MLRPPSKRRLGRRPSGSGLRRGVLRLGFGVRLGGLGLPRRLLVLGLPVLGSGGPLGGLLGFADGRLLRRDLLRHEFDARQGRVVASAIAIGGVLYLLDSAWGYGSTMLPAPQAMLMKMVVEGVMEGNLPWTLVFVGVGIGIAVEILGIPVLPFAVGLYLPIHLSTPIMVGGLIRLWFEKRKFKSEKARKATIDSGVLYMSGMIAGEGLVGILLAVFAVIPVKKLMDGTTINLGNVIDLSARGISIGQIGGLVVFALLLLTVLKFTLWRKSEEK